MSSTVGSTTARTPKGARTRERLFEVATRHFRSEGFEAVSMRRIARDADVTPALLYRYFANKEAIVAELYARSTLEWKSRAVEMPKGTWIERCLWLTRLAFEVLAPHRELLRVLSASMVEGNPSTSPLFVRDSIEAAATTFERALVEARDAPKPRDLDALLDLAYLGHLSIVLFWVMDQSEEQTATDVLLEQVAALAPLFGVGLRMPIVGKKLRGLGGTVMHGLRGERVPFRAVLEELRRSKEAE